MSKHSVEEVRAHARMLRECRINTEATRDRQQDKLADICDAYADLLERLKADDELCSPTLTECPRCKNDHAAALADPKCTMTHPPAQAAQVQYQERWHSSEGSCDWYPICREDYESELANPTDGCEVRIAPTTEPVVQGEVVYQRHLAVPGYWEDITREQWEIANRRDTRVVYTAQSYAMPKAFIEDIQRAERLALKSKKLNRERMMGLAVVKHLSHLFAAAPSPGESK